ncbi:hypothetical protein PCANC_19793 [Puccinia coronata f. sp. avenae]|uniref:Uncharacterized protein n=1 Tax=Puccinia coronata f. sp. avenae TaxID=200324 RepID=A0A2N5S9S4_9BASI|nr:hypothetical protein PCANC_19793 [Puccinia coronata f. sp. avenae]
MQSPRGGTYPQGAYVNSSNVKVGFFTEPERLARIEALTNQMPFLYRLVEGKLQADETTSADLEDGDEPPPNEEEESQDNTAMSGSAEDLPATTPGGIKLFPNIPNDPGTTHTAKDRFVASEADVNEIEGGFYLKSKDRQVRRKVRVETVRSTIHFFL